MRNVGVIKHDDASFPGMNRCNSHGCRGCKSLAFDVRGVHSELPTHDRYILAVLIDVLSECSRRIDNDAHDFVNLATECEVA